MKDLFFVNLTVAQIVGCTEAEGPGRRFALWFQGCPLRCPGCCNPEMLSFEGGLQQPLEAIIVQLELAQREHNLEGITLLGGEPTAHAEASLAVAQAAHQLDLNVMIFTGYLLEELQQRNDRFLTALLQETDILVDGPYDSAQPETERRWIGSKNQRIHFLTSRCDPNDPRWQMKNTLEIRLHGSELTVNGFPAKSAVGLWKRPKPSSSRSSSH